MTQFARFLSLFIFFCIPARIVFAQTDCNLDTSCINNLLCSKKAGWRFNNTHSQNMNSGTYWYFSFQPNKTLTIYRSEKSNPNLRKPVYQTTYSIKPYNSDLQLGVEIANFNSNIALFLYHVIPKEQFEITFFQFAYNPTTRKLLLNYHKSGPITTINEFE